jgi:hypothetical protein
MVPEILKIQMVRRRFKNNGPRKLSYLKVQNAQWALDHADKNDTALVAKLQAELAECEAAYLKATVEKVGSIAGYFRKEIRQAKRNGQPASFVSSLQETLNHQKAVIAAAKAELKLRGIK